MSIASIHRSGTLILALAAALGASGAAADMNSGRSSAAAHFEVDRAMCLRGITAQDLAICLREAEAAYADARREGLQDGAPEIYAANRFRRCELLPGAQRVDCVARMMGYGTISGSVAGGGIYRELVYTVDSGIR